MQRERDYNANKSNKKRKNFRRFGDDSWDSSEKKQWNKHLKPTNKVSVSSNANTDTKNQKSDQTPISSEDKPAIPGYYYDPQLRKYFKIPSKRESSSIILNHAALRTAPPPIDHEQELKKIKKQKTIPSHYNLTTQQQISGHVSPWKFMEQYYSDKNFTMATEYRGRAKGEMLKDVNEIAINKTNKTIVTGSKSWVCTFDYGNNFELKKFLRASTEISSIKWCPKNIPLMIVTEFGSMAASGLLSVMDVNLEVKHNFNLKKGSLWTSEWDPSVNKISMGVTAMGLLLDISSNKVSRLYTNKSDVFTQQWDSNCQVVLNGCRNGNILPIDIRTNRSLQAMSHNFSISHMKLLRDENYIIASSLDGAVKQWDRRLLKPVVEIDGNQTVESTILVKFQLDESENTLFIGDKDKFIRIYSLKSGKLLNYIGPFPEIKKSMLYCSDENIGGQLLVPENQTLQFYKQVS